MTSSSPRADADANSAMAAAASSHANAYIREVLHTAEVPSIINARYFYTSPLAIDDPLSPLPPPATGASSAKKQPPRPFSQYDNNAINETWSELRKKILRHNEEVGEKAKTTDALPGGPTNAALARLKRKRGGSVEGEGGLDSKSSSLARDIPSSRSVSREMTSQSMEDGGRPGSSGGSRTRGVTLTGSLRAMGMDPAESSSPLLGPTTTGTPFIRAPSRGNVSTQRKNSTSQDGQRRPAPSNDLDSYKWDDDMDSALPGLRDKAPAHQLRKPKAGPSAKVPVGVSRLHHVVMDTESIRMEPIYWTPVNDIARVLRGTWFYKDDMMPVEVDVANMLEAGYLEMKPWTETWKDELNSAVEVGALGEMKILHRLWPEKLVKVESRPGTSQQMMTEGIQNTLLDEPDDPEKERRDIVENACDLIDISTGPGGADNKAAGDTEYGHAGRKNLYRSAGVIYSNDKDAYILRPSLQPSSYYGRRPLANYIRKNRPIGIHVVRGFDQAIWDKLHPPKKGHIAQMAREGVSTSQGGVPPFRRQKSDPALAQSERPQVTDLVLVIHGIGQKLSERMETFHFTHAINAFRREVNVELGSNEVKKGLRKDMGGIMVLPVNWRIGMSMEDDPTNLTAVSSGDVDNDPAANKYTLKDITPDTLPSVRGIVSDVMLDVPYYLSPEHHPKMVTACINEANRIYRLWCQNNPGFAEWGKVHLIAHSLGSVMAMDILSDQPTTVDPFLGDPAYPESDLPKDHFIFNTTNLFVCGSPVGFFLLLRKATLLPRKDKRKPGLDIDNMRGVGGDRGNFGCIAVDNIYNIVNGYDPVAYRLNAAVDVDYAASLKPAIIPSSTSSLFSLPSLNPFRSGSPSESTPSRPAPTARLPSNVELETHNFTREEIAEKRAFLLNDNGQVDFWLRYGGGALELKYLTMLGAHSSYWIHQDFVRMIVGEVGRERGKGRPAMRAVKRGVGR